MQAQQQRASAAAGVPPPITAPSVGYAGATAPAGEPLKTEQRPALLQ